MTHELFVLFFHVFTYNILGDLFLFFFSLVHTYLEFYILRTS